MTKSKSLFIYQIIFTKVDPTIIVENIFPVTSTNNKNMLKQNKCDCAVFKSSLKNFKCF